MKMRVVLFQKQLGTSVTHGEIAGVRRFRPHFICFPEYFFVNVNFENQFQTPHNQERQLERIAVLSRELSTVIIGGTMPELAEGRLYNTSFVFHDGKLLGRYRKKRLFFAELDKITPGESYRIFHAYGINFGVIICADVFDDAGFYFMREHGARIIFAPTFSPKKTETVEEKFKRDNDLYVRGARISDTVIVKVCGVGSERRNYLQARSLIANARGIVFRVMPDEEDTEMIIMKEIEV
jgi:predicted amidohydrolase